MADLSDVETALVTAAAAALMPATAQPPIGDPQPLRVYRGWPVSGLLDADLAVGGVHVSVFPVPGAARNTTRWNNVATTPTPSIGLTVATSGNAAVFGGTGGAGQLAGILAGETSYVYATQVGDTPPLIAAVLANLIRATQPCWLSGAMVTVPGVASIVARTAAMVNVLEEVRRQEQQFRVTVWAPSPTLRDLVGAALDGYLARIAFLPLADGTGGRLRYRSTGSFDEGQDATLFRRDIVLEVEYATTVQLPTATMLFGDLVINGATIIA